MRPRTLTAMLVLGMPAVASYGGPLRTDWIAADADWIIHVDVEALNASSIAPVMHDPEGLPIDGIDGGLDEMARIEQELGIVLEEEVLGVTLWGRAEDAGILLLEITPEGDEALARLSESDATITVSEPDRAGVVQFVVSPPDAAPTYGQARPYPGHDDRRLIVMSDLVDGVNEVASWIEGSAAPSLADDAGSAHGKPRPGSLVFISAINVSGFEDVADSEVVRRTERAVVDISEHEGMLRGLGVVTAESEEAARDVSDVLGAILVFGRWIADEEPDLEPLAEICRAIRIDAHGSDIRLEFECPVE